MIISYHSVWLGFELFGLRVQVYSQLVLFTLARKGYDNNLCHNKPPERKWGWSMEDVILGRDGSENLRILKLVIRTWRHRVEFSTVQSQIESYQRLKKWYLMPLYLSLSIKMYGSRVNWINPWKGVAPSPTPRYSSQLYFLLTKYIVNLLKRGSL